MSRIWIWFGLMGWLLSCSTAQAVTITRNELPSHYQTCRPQCFVSTTSEVDLGAMSAFRYQELGSNRDSGWLLRYSVYAVGRTPLDTTVTPTGYLWLRASSSYDLSQSHHSMTLFTDRMILPPNSAWGSDADPRDWDFNVSTAALLSGGGHYTHTCCTDPTSDSTVIPLSDPSFPEEGPRVGGPIVCLADGCRATGQLSFIYFLYQSDPNDPNRARLAFDPTRAASLLYSQSSSYNDWFSEQNFYLTPVPLPPAFLLLLSGFGAVAWRRRRGTV